MTEAEAGPTGQQSSESADQTISQDSSSEDRTAAMPISPPETRREVGVEDRRRVIKEKVIQDIESGEDDEGEFLVDKLEEVLKNDPKKFGNIGRLYSQTFEASKNLADSVALAKFDNGVTALRKQLRIEGEEFKFGQKVEVGTGKMALSSWRMRELNRIQTEIALYVLRREGYIDQKTIAELKKEDLGRDIRRDGITRIEARLSANAYQIEEKRLEDREVDILVKYTKTGKLKTNEFTDELLKIRSRRLNDEPKSFEGFYQKEYEEIRGQEIVQKYLVGEDLSQISDNAFLNEVRETQSVLKERVGNLAAHLPDEYREKTKDAVLAEGLFKERVVKQVILGRVRNSLQSETQNSVASANPDLVCDQVSEFHESKIRLDENLTDLSVLVYVVLGIVQEKEIADLEARVNQAEAGGAPAEKETKRLKKELKGKKRNLASTINLQDALVEESKRKARAHAEKKGLRERFNETLNNIRLRFRGKGEYTEVRKELNGRAEERRLRGTRVETEKKNKVLERDKWKNELIHNTKISAQVALVKTAVFGVSSFNFLKIVGKKLKEGPYGLNKEEIKKSWEKVVEGGKDAKSRYEASESNREFVKEYSKDILVIGDLVGVSASEATEHTKSIDDYRSELETKNKEVNQKLLESDIWVIQDDVDDLLKEYSESSEILDKRDVLNRVVRVMRDKLETLEKKKPFHLATIALLTPVVTELSSKDKEFSKKIQEELNLLREFWNQASQEAQGKHADTIARVEKKRDENPYFDKILVGLLAGYQIVDSQAATAQRKPEGPRRFPRGGRGTPPTGKGIESESEILPDIDSPELLRKGAVAARLLKHEFVEKAGEKPPPLYVLVWKTPDGKYFRQMVDLGGKGLDKVGDIHSIPEEVDTDDINDVADWYAFIIGKGNQKKLEKGEKVNEITRISTDVNFTTERKKYGWKLVKERGKSTQTARGPEQPTGQPEQPQPGTSAPEAQPQSGRTAPLVGGVTFLVALHGRLRGTTQEVKPTSGVPAETPKTSAVALKPEPEGISEAEEEAEVPVQPEALALAVPPEEVPLTPPEAGNAETAT